MGRGAPLPPSEGFAVEGKLLRVHSGVMLRPASLLVLLALATTACAPRPSSPDGSTADAATADGATSAVPYAYFGLDLVRIELVQPQTTTVTAQLWSDEPPPTFPMRVTMHEGECDLLETNIPFCPTRCSSDEVCVADGVCKRRPSLLALGAVTLNGLRRVDMASTSALVAGTAGLTVPGEQLQYPPFAAGESVRWDIAASPAFEALTVELPAIDEMRVLSLEPHSAPQQPLDVRWEPPRAPAPEGQRVIVAMDFTHHAGLRGTISCTTDDDGSFTIPASVITGLHALGTAGWPALFVTRTLRRDRMVGSTRARFEIRSEKELYVAIDGLISCRDDSDCPAGRTCQSNFTCTR